MKRQNYGPRLGKLVFQLPRDVTLAYYLRLTHMVHHYKDLSDDYNFFHKYPFRNRMIFFGGAMPKKHRLGPQNSSRSLGPEKLLKIVSCAETEKMKEAMVGPQVE